MTKTQSLFSIELTHVRNGNKRAAKFYPPVKVSIDLPEQNTQVERWDCKYSIKEDGRWKIKLAPGETWLGALLLAVEGFRRTIPRKEADQWKTAEGLPSWIVLPVEVPIAWGYEPYKRFYSAMLREERAYVRQVAKRRRANDK